MTTTRIAVVALSTVIALLRAAAADAQDKPAVFVHGFMSSGATWEEAASRLQAKYTIDPYLPSLPWRQHLDDQAAQLHSGIDSRFGTAASPVVLSHSLGGLVSRELAKGRSIDGIVTLGTPHWGAPVINHSWSLIAYYMDMSAAAFNVIHVLGTAVWDISDKWYWVFDDIAQALRNSSGFANDPFWLVYLNLLRTATVPVSEDAYAFSPYIGDLNSTTHLNREATSIPGRVGIVNTAQNFLVGGPFRILAPESADTIGLVITITYYALTFTALAVDIFDPLDPKGHDISNALLDLAFYVDNFEWTWCYSVSSPLPWIFRDCRANDGLIPAWSQEYPGAVLLRQVGPAHTRETRQSDPRLEEALNVFLHVPRRDETPPPPPPDQCTFSVAPTATDVGDQGGSRPVTVMASADDCGWSASSQASWITIDGSSSGVGSGALSLSITPNPSTAARSGVVVVAGETVLVSQAGVGCVFELSPIGATFGSLASSGSVGVSTPDDTCQWTASSNSPWLAITDGSTGVGDGTVAYSVSANTTSATRTGTLSIAGRSFVVTQQGNAAPVAIITRPLPEALFARGANIEIDVTATDPDGTVAAVEFYVGTVLIATDTTAPYSAVWQNATSGRHTLTAKVYDDASNWSTSAALVIGVNSLDAVTVTPSSLQSGESAVITVTGANPCGALTFDYGDERIITHAITELPYSHTTSWTSGGTKYVTVRGESTCVGELTTTVAVTGNQAAVVTLTSPANAAQFLAPAAITLAATASDPDGSIARVDFYNGPTVIGSVTSAPYSIVWSNVLAGQYSISAVAIDNAGASAASGAHGIVVTDVGAITVSPASPKEGQAASVTVTGSSTCGAIGIDYGDGTVIVYAISGLPTTQAHTWSTAGTKTITATGHGNCQGQTNTAVTIASNALPSVALTSPATDSIIVHPEPVTVAADASDPDGTILRVEFYAGETLIGSASSAPYSMSWSPPVGVHSITARAFDDTSGVATSAASSLTVTHVGSVTVSPSSAVTGQPVAVAVNGSSACGAVQIDYGDGTVITYALSGLPTTQTHTWATVGAKTIVATGQSSCYGTAAGSITIEANQPPGVSMTEPTAGSTYTSGTLVTVSATATDSHGVAQVDFYAGATLIGSDNVAPYAIAWAIPSGTHSLTAHAIDIYGATASSTAVSVSASDVVAVTVSPSPLVTGQSGTVTVSGSSSCGAVTIDYGDGTAITYALSGLPTSQSHVWTLAGTYTVTATGQSTCIGSVSMTVTVDTNSAPSVSLTEPADGSAYVAGTTITLTASATDSHGVERVEFYAGATLLGSDMAAPYSMAWAIPSGTHSLSARAIDIYGAAATSAAVTVSARDVTGVSVSPATITAGTAATVTVSGSSSCGAVTIDYGDGTAITYAISGLPISRTYTWASSGWKTVTATGQSSCIGQASTSVYINAPPSVALTSPVSGNTYSGPATVDLAANATDSDGSVVSVTFYANGVLLATDTAAPYTYTWTNVSVGTYTITAVATDNSGATASSAVSITVSDPGPSRVTSIAVTPSPVGVGQTATVTVYGTNPCGAVQVDFGDGQAPVIPISGLPYVVDHVWYARGTYTLRAIGHGNCSGQVSTTLIVQ